MTNLQKYPNKTKVRKAFDGVYYKGVIVGFDTLRKFYKVRYEDSDEEELDESEISQILFSKNENNISRTSAKRKVPGKNDCSKRIRKIESQPQCREKCMKRVITSDTDEDSNNQMKDERDMQGKKMKAERGEKNKRKKIEKKRMAQCYQVVVDK